jgi:aspartyl protease family protein
MPKQDIAIPQLPSRSLTKTLQFYSRFGFRGEIVGPAGDYAILERGRLEVHFFLYEALKPEESAFSDLDRTGRLRELVRFFHAGGLEFNLSPLFIVFRAKHGSGKNITHLRCLENVAASDFLDAGQQHLPMSSIVVSDKFGGNRRMPQQTDSTGEIVRNSIIQFSAGVFSAALAMQSVFAAQIYKCKNPEGRLLYQKTPCAAEAESLSSFQTSKISPSKTPEALSPLLLKQHDSGHYLVDGAVNGKPLVFMIDTGASVVSLPRDEASAAGIVCKAKAVTDTANGRTEACTAVIPELRFGHFLVKDAAGMIVPNLRQPLLGMNILQNFKIAQDKGEMRISVP